MRPNVIIIGGYGVFGADIVRDILEHTDLHVTIVGRNIEKAKRTADHFSERFGDRVSCAMVDVFSPSQLKELLRGGFAVVNCVGNYSTTAEYVVRAAIDENCHYIDLSDTRIAFKNIQKVIRAHENIKICIISGMGTVPGLSSLMVYECASHLKSIDSVEISLFLGGGNPFGPAAIATVLELLNEKVPCLKDKHIISQLLLTESKKIEFPSPIGRRRAYLYDSPEYDYLPQSLGTGSFVVRFSLDPPGTSILLKSIRLMSKFIPRDKMVKILSRLQHKGRTEVCLKVEVWGNGVKEGIYVLGEGIGLGSAPAGISIAGLLSGDISAKGLILPGPPLNWKLFEDGLIHRGFEIGRA